MLTNWHTWKFQFVDATHLSRDVLHVHLGLLAFMAAYAVFSRTSRPALFAWLTVAGLEVVNEYLDACTWPIDYCVMNARDTLGDGLNTLLWPTVLAFVLWPKARSR